MSASSYYAVGTHHVRNDHQYMRSWNGQAWTDWQLITYKKIGQREFSKNGALQRKVGETQWKAVEQQRTPSPPSYKLSLVVQEQLYPDKDHWSLFDHQENKPGNVYQVKGDTLQMRHLHAANIDITSSNSFRAIYTIANMTSAGRERLNYWAHNIPAPKAANAASIQSNCQGWIILVLEKLEAEGYVSAAKVAQIRALKQQAR